MTTKMKTKSLNHADLLDTDVTLILESLVDTLYIV